ncbi:MAG: hypothetical protein EP330_26705 [Deltaproteobacteria bacterium]|nr:MAG: hypothetical protein EP330_26705 [Deltaproteobacteria bacterium]
MRRTAFLLAATLLPAVAFGGFRVSSFKKQNRMGASEHNAAAALDGKGDTAWMTDPEQENAGQWFELEIPKAEVDKLALIIGWDKSEEDFKDYARVKTMKVEVFDLAGGDDTGKLAMEYTARFEDKQGWQVIDIPNAKVGDEVFGGRVRLTVTGAYPGVDFPNLAIGEVLVHLAEIDAPTKVVTPPTSIAAGHPAEAMTDGNRGTYWLSETPEDQAFEVGADGFGVSRIGVRNGPKTYSRPKKLEITYSDQVREIELADSQDMQWFDLPSITGFTGSGWGDVDVKILETYAGTKEGIGIAEVELKATTFDGM